MNIIIQISFYSRATFKLATKHVFRNSVLSTPKFTLKSDSKPCKGTENHVSKQVIFKSKVITLC